MLVGNQCTQFRRVTSTDASDGPDLTGLGTMGSIVLTCGYGPRQTSGAGPTDRSRPGASRRAGAGPASRDAHWTVWVVSYVDPLHPDEMLFGGALVVTDDGEVHEIDSQHDAVDELMWRPELATYVEEQRRKRLKDWEDQQLPK